MSLVQRSIPINRCTVRIMMALLHPQFYFSMKFRSSILAILTGILSVSGFSQTTPGIQFEHGTIAEIKAKAAQEKKLIFVDAYTSWCGPCKWMAKAAFPLPEVGQFYNANFINAKIDMEKGEGIELAKLHSVTMYPTLLFLNAEGAVVHRTVGARDGKDLIELGKIALNPDLNLAGLAMKFKGNPSSFPAAYSYLAALRDAESTDQKAAFDEYIATQDKSTWINLPNWRILFDFVRNAENPLFMHFLENREAFTAKYSADSVNSKLKEVYYGELKEAANYQDAVRFTKSKESIRKLNLQGSDKVISESEIAYAGENLELMAQKIVDHMNRFGSSNPDELNEYAWRMFEISIHKPHLQLAEGWAKKGAELAPGNSAVIDTYANLLFKNGKKAEAKVQAEKAIQVGEKLGSDVSGTKTLLEEINASLKATVKKAPSVKKAVKK